ncbi:hypothetical protein ABW21_db0203659 [Orbilia brochopaga]|nr:hypothetical protein ABW21_db0203659 [Drechslerella brochopaga]
MEFAQPGHPLGLFAQRIDPYRTRIYNLNQRIIKHSLFSSEIAKALDELRDCIGSQDADAVRALRIVLFLTHRREDLLRQRVLELETELSRLRKVLLKARTDQLMAEESLTNEMAYRYTNICDEEVQIDPSQSHGDGASTPSDTSPEDHLLVEELNRNLGPFGESPSWPKGICSLEDSMKLKLDNIIRGQQEVIKGMAILDGAIPLDPGYMDVDERPAAATEFTPTASVADKGKQPDLSFRQPSDWSGHLESQAKEIHDEGTKEVNEETNDYK